MYKRQHLDVYKSLVTSYEEEVEDFLNIFSLMKKHGSITTLPNRNKQDAVAEERGSCAVQSQNTICQLERYLRPCFGNSTGILLIDILHEQRTVNAPYSCKLVEAAYHNKRHRQRMHHDAIPIPLH